MMSSQDFHGPMITLCYLRGSQLFLQGILPLPCLLEGIPILFFQLDPSLIILRHLRLQLTPTLCLLRQLNTLRLNCLVMLRRPSTQLLFRLSHLLFQPIYLLGGSCLC